MEGKNLTQNIRVCKQQANSAARDGVPSVFLKAVTESSALPTSECCIKCSDAAQYWCIECGPVAYFCHVCFGEAHSCTNLFDALLLKCQVALQDLCKSAVLQMSSYSSQGM